MPKNFKIFDEQGNFVKEITGNSSLMEENKVKINTSDLKKGAYIYISMQKIKIPKDIKS